MIELTRHGEKRIRQRLGVPRSAALKVAQKAYDEGGHPRDFSGSFRRYLDSIYFNQGVATWAAVYTGWLFLFNGKHLITVLPVPPRYRGAKPHKRIRKIGMTTLDMDAVADKAAAKIAEKHSMSIEEARDIALIVIDEESQEMERLGLFGDAPDEDRAATVQ